MFLILALVGNISFEGLGREMDAVCQTPLLSLKHLGLPWALHQWGSQQLEWIQTWIPWIPDTATWTCYRKGPGPWLYPWSKLSVPEGTFLPASRKSGGKSLLTEDCSTSVKTTTPRNLKQIIPVSVFCLPCHGVVSVQVWIELAELCALRRCCCYRLSYNCCDSGLRAYTHIS